MKAILIYGAALLALCVLIFRKDQTQPTATGKFDARVTVPGLDDRDYADRLVRGMVDYLLMWDAQGVGQVAPEGMLS